MNSLAKFSLFAIASLRVSEASTALPAPPPRLTLQGDGTPTRTTRLKQG